MPFALWWMHGWQRVATANADMWFDLQRWHRGDLASSMEYSEKILSALRLGASAWMAFEWAHPAPNQAGLISTHWGAGVPKKRFWRSKSYYAFRQIVNTSPAGGNVNEIQMKLGDKEIGKGFDALAISKDDQLVVHMLNPSHRPVEYELKIQGDPKLQSQRKTGPDANDKPIEEPSKTGQLEPYTLMSFEFSLK